MFPPPLKSIYALMSFLKHKLLKVTLILTLTCVTHFDTLMVISCPTNETNTGHVLVLVSLCSWESNVCKPKFSYI